MAGTRRAITFTFDLEDHRPHTPDGHRLAKRFPDNTRRLMDFLDEQAIRGTFFTVGELARSDAGLIREVAGRGHEIACHSLDHTPIAHQSPRDFTRHSRDAKEALEDCTGQPVTGYRAPVFSLVRETVWATGILKDLGFAYSSSVLPAANPLYGFAGAPQGVFRWPDGLVEIPAPTGRFGPFTLPYLGGIYFRYLPLSAISRHAQNTAQGAVLWHYSHPYDFDPQERYFRLRGASHPVSLALWLKRGKTFRRLEKLADRFDFDVPFAQQINRPAFRQAPVWRAGQTTAG